MNFLLPIKTLDESLFFLINNLPHTYISDHFFLFFSLSPIWVWLIIGTAIFFIEERTDKLFIVRLMLALFLGGIFASGIIKPLIKRPRPDLAHGVRVVVVEEKPAAYPKSNDYAFPSGHATLAFAGAFIVSQAEKHKKGDRKKQKKISKVLIYGIAFIIALSRIYLGKHYPLDVIAGGFLGTAIGWGTWKLVDLVKNF